ncbi:molybdopterin-dependent oxidoreductase [Streptomyces sp. NPDC004520]|uniref:molybdopterin-dependent oxidoreductase n=1 Tax=Streptomyces sp. NPDC004520 TaxID=3364702 RepID=UPI0036A0AD59
MNANDGGTPAPHHGPARSTGTGPEDDGDGGPARSTETGPEDGGGPTRLARLRSAPASGWADGPPRGPSRPEFWRSPLRGPWLTAVFGIVLLFGITVLFVTGLLSYTAYDPDLSAVNDQTPDKGWLGFHLFSWPTSPYWLYRVTQGVHVTLGVVLVPVLLAKLWSVIPKLFAWPPVRSAAQAVERLSLLLLVGGAGFEFATGILNVQLHYVFPGSFYTLHLYGAWVFIGAFTVHVALRLRRTLRALRAGPRPPAPDSEEAAGLVSPRPAAPTISRRGALGMVGLGSLALFLVTAGQSVGGRLRETALLAPHGQEPGSGPNGFQINKTAASVGIRPSDLGPAWRLTVRGAGRQIDLTYDRLLALPQNEALLPIACVEGWSTPDQLWSGVRLTDLAALVGLGAHTPRVLVESLQRGGSFSSVVLSGAQARDPRSLLAVRVNGAALSHDHGYPARTIVPGAPGVHNTKWVTRLTFGEPA